MKAEKILEEETERIRLADSEVAALNNTAKKFIDSLQKVGLTAYVGGSLAKGTMVRKSGKQDLDIFVVHDYSEDIFKTEKILRKLKLPGELKVVHGSRDYFQIDTSAAILEVIPVVKNVDPELAENVTDVSLAHVKYVTGEIQKSPKIADEVRLAKAFAQAQKCYGAESYIKGFSGYSLEVLTIYYGGFLKMLKSIGKKKVIDPCKYFRNEKEVMREINASKLISPLIIVDPTYKYRNVTAGLGEEAYEKFKRAAKYFLKKPSSEFFVKKEFDVEAFKAEAEKNKAILIEVKMKTDKQEGDIAGSKMRKFFDFFGNELKRKQQEILTSEFEYRGKGNEAIGFVVVKEKREIKIRGPPVGLEEAVEKFRKSRKEIYKKGKFYYTKEKCSVEEIYEGVKKEEKEMGVKSEMKIYIKR